MYYITDRSRIQCLVFEDAVNGVISGHSAGMQVVWVPDPRADRKVVQDKAVLILNCLDEFKPEDFGLPPYEQIADTAL